MRRLSRRRDDLGLETAAINTTPHSSPERHAPAREPSPAARSAAAWFRQLARALRVCRLYSGDNPIAAQARAGVIDQLLELLEPNGGWFLRFKPDEILLGEQSVVRARSRRPGEDKAAPAPEERLPMFFHRDGIRQLTILSSLSRSEAEALFDCLTQAMGTVRHEDLVTLLWQANLSCVQVDAVPLEQAIYLSTSPTEGRPEEGGGTSPGASVPGAEIRSELGQHGGMQALHRDTFDDWLPPAGGTDVAGEYERLLPDAGRAVEQLRAAWEAEAAVPWTEQAPPLMREILRLSPGEETRAALAHSASSWLAAALQCSAFTEARTAHDLLREFDPDLSRSEPVVAVALAALDPGDVMENLDEASPHELGQFSGLMVGIGRPALPLTVGVLVASERSRTRAAMSIALHYLCADDPQLLAPYLADPRWFVVRNVVFVLGQIGGSEVVDLLRLAAQHPDPRVRRQVVQSLGSVPEEERVPLFLSWLDTPDPQILSATLQMLVRESSAIVTRALLGRIEAPGFDARDEAMQRALFNALAEVADDEAVPALEAIVLRTGWLSRRTFARAAAAHTLIRIGTERARAVIDTGLKSKHKLVRDACLEAAGKAAA